MEIGRPFQMVMGATRRVRLAIVAIALLVGAQAPTTAQTPNSLAETIGALRSFRLTEEMAFGSVPPEVAALLRKLKRELRSFIEASLSDPLATKWSSLEMKHSILERLEQEGITVGRVPQFEGYGAVIAIDIEPGARSLPSLFVRTAISVPCGSDTSLYLFRRDGFRWKLAVAFEKSNYASIGDAQEALRYFLPPEGNGIPDFVVACGVPPWCTSCWSSVRCTAVRPTTDPDNPQVLRDATMSVYRCADPAYSVVTQRDGFTVLTEAESEDEPGMHAVHIAHYALSGNSAQRGRELVWDPQSFIAAWVSEAWDEAVKQVVASRAEAIEARHAELHGKAEGGLDTEILLPDSTASDSHDIRITARAFGLYFTVVLSGKRFLIEDIGSHSPRHAAAPGEVTYFTGGRSNLVDPVLIMSSRVEPRFPEKARKRGLLAGRVELGVEVRADGSVGDVGVLESPGPELGFDVAAIRAVRRWKYTPATIDGKPVNSEIRVILDFHDEPGHQ